jgi:hypothetical protein
MEDKLSTAVASNAEHNTSLLTPARRDKLNQSRTQDVKLQHFKVAGSDCETHKVSPVDADAVRIGLIDSMFVVIVCEECL